MLLVKEDKKSILVLLCLTFQFIPSGKYVFFRNFEIGVEDEGIVIDCI